MSLRRDNGINLYKNFKIKITKNQVIGKPQGKYKSTQSLLKSLENVLNFIILSFEIYDNSLFVLVDNIPLIVIDGKYAYKSVFNKNRIYNTNIIHGINENLSKLKSEIERDKTYFYELIIDSYLFNYFDEINVLDDSSNKYDYEHYKIQSISNVKNIIESFNTKVIVDIENSTTLFPLLSDYMTNVTLIYSTYNEKSIPNKIKKQLSEYNLYKVPFQQKDAADIIVIMYSSFVSNNLQGDVILFTCDHFAKVMKYFKDDLLGPNYFDIFCNINNFFQFLNNIESL